MVAAPAGDLTPIRRALHRYVWDEPRAAVQGPAVTRVRRGQVHVALVGVALWLGGLIPGILPWPGPVYWSLGLVALVGVVALFRIPRESVALTVTVLATAVVVLVTTRAQEPGSPLAAAWFDAAAVSTIGLATLRRALWWIATIGVVSVVSWGVLAASTGIDGGWRSAVVWPVASVSLGLTSAVLAAIVRAGGRRLDDMAVSAQQAVTADEVLQAERSEYLTTARLLHDTVINTLTAIGRGVPEADLAALRLRCRQDLDLIDATLAQEQTRDLVTNAQDRAAGLGLDLVVRGPRDALRRVPQPMIEAAAGAVDEALLNTAKHARVPSAELIIEEQPGGIELVVRDTGRGYSGVTARRGGIQESIVARCAAAGIGSRVESTAGHGTVVTLTIPVSDAAAEQSEEMFGEESRLMTVIVCGVLLVDMGIRTVLTAGLEPWWGSVAAYLLLVSAMAWPWVRRSTSPRPAPLRPSTAAPLGLAVVGLPVVLLLPQQQGAVSWIWWGSIAGIAIFLALVSMTASVWWVVLAYVLQIGGRYVAGSYSLDLVVPDAFAVGVGAATAVWIRRRVLTLLRDSATVASDRDRARRDLVHETARHQQSLRGLRVATDAGRRPLELIANGSRTGAEADVRAQAGSLAAYLRNFARVGPDLGEVGGGLVRLLDAALAQSAPVALNIDSKVRLPEEPARTALAGLICGVAESCRSEAGYTVSLLSRREGEQDSAAGTGRGARRSGALLTVLAPQGSWAPQQVAALEVAGLQVQSEDVDDQQWIEAAWDLCDRQAGLTAGSAHSATDMVL